MKPSSTNKRQAKSAKKAVGSSLKQSKIVIPEDADGVEVVPEENKEVDVNTLIDNLPKNPHELETTLKQVRKEAFRLEKEFFEAEIDSDDETKVKSDEKVPATNSTVRQFWCIPLSIDVLKYDFNKLAKA